MGSSQTGRIVHAVPDHGHQPALARQITDFRQLLFWPQLRADFIDAKFLAKVFGSRAAVASKHNGGKPRFVEILQNTAGLAPYVIAKNYPTEKVLVGQPNFRKSSFGRRNT